MPAAASKGGGLCCGVSRGGASWWVLAHARATGDRVHKEHRDGEEDDARPVVGLRLAHALEGKIDVAEVGGDVLCARHLRRV